MIYRAQRYTLLYTVLGMLLWAGCSDIMPPPNPHTKGNGIKISISADTFNGRTLYPDAIFTKYVLSFSGPLEHEDVTLESGTTSVLIDDLVLGVWTITAKGYVKISGSEYAAAEGSAAVTVISGKTQNLTIHISAQQKDEVSGFFSYSVKYPSSKINSGNINIYRVGDYERSGDSYGLYNGAASRSIELTPGYYVMTIRLYNSYQTAVRTEIVHIYSNMETKAEYTFVEDDFIDLITLNGSIDIRVNGELPESADIYAYLNTGSGYYDNEIGNSRVNLSDKNTWSMVIPAFDQDTFLYFRVEASIDGSYMEKRTDKSVTVKDQNRTVNLGTVNIEAITLRGTINVTYNKNPMTNIEIRANNQTQYRNSYTSLSSPAVGAPWSITMPAFDSPTDITFKVRGTYYSEENNYEPVLNKYVENLTITAFNKDVTSIAINLGNIPNSFAPVGVNPLAADTWVDGNITDEYTIDWYSINVTKGTTYYLWWNDSEGNSTKTMNVDVYAWYKDGAIIPINYHDYAWNYPASFTAASNTTVYFRVRAYYGENYTGTYGIAYSTNSRRPKIGSFSGSLTDKLNFVKINADYDDDPYVIELNANETIEPQYLYYSGKAINIILKGDKTGRIISLTRDGYMFYVGSRVTLTLENNVTLEGRNNNSDSLVKVDYYGALIMGTGSKITGNNTAYYSGGGVYSSGTFTMNGGTISGNTAYNSGGGIYITSGAFIKTGGTIYGYSAGGNNSNVVKDNSGIVQEDRGHAVYAHRNGNMIKRKETTAGPELDLSWIYNSGLPAYSGDWDN